MAYLVIQLENKPPARRKLDGDVEIGRGLGADVWIQDKDTSRRHCRIYLNADQWMIEDLGSTNGTYIDGQKISSQLLRDGEVIQLGNTRIVFHNSEMKDDRSARPGKPTDLSDSQRVDMDGTAMIPHAGRPLPKVSVEKSEQPADDRPKKPIAFQRPPAQPIVPPKPAPVEEPKKPWWKRVTGK